MTPSELHHEVVAEQERIAKLLQKATELRALIAERDATPVGSEQTDEQRRRFSAVSGYGGGDVDFLVVCIANASAELSGRSWRR